MMNHEMEPIRNELLQMKEELQSRLFEYSLFDSPSNQSESNLYKKATLMHHIKEELQDVLLALDKMEHGCFGMCEETGAELPLDKLSVLPTARTYEDFRYHAQFEKKTLPVWPVSETYEDEALYN